MPGQQRANDLIVPISKHRKIAFLTLLLFVSFIVLTIAAKQRELRQDEAIALDGMRGNLLTTVEYQTRELQSPVYFAVLYLWKQAVGYDEFALRVLSVLISLITLGVLFRMGKESFGSPWNGMVVLVTLVCSAYFFVYAVEIRPYPLLMLSATLSMYRFQRWLQTPSRLNAALYGLTVAFVLYVHYLGASLFLIQGIYFFIHKRLSRTLIRQGLIAATIAFLIFLPWLPTFVSQVRFSGGLATKLGTTRVSGLGVAVTAIPTSSESVTEFVMLATNGQPVLYGIIAFVGIILLWRKRNFFLAAIWALGTPIAIFAINVVVPIYDPRYASHAAPGIALFVGLSVAAFPKRLRLGATVIFCTLALLGVRSGVPNRVPMREILREAEAAYRPGDGVFLIKTPYTNMEYYQYHQYAPSLATFLDTPTYSEFAAQVMRVDSSLPRCLWFITSDLYDATVKDVFQRLSNGRPLQLVVGNLQYPMQRLCAPPSNVPVVFGSGPSFLGADIDTMTNSLLTLKLWWTVEQQLGSDYSFGVYVLDSQGQLVAQKDGPINDFWGRGIFQTSTLIPGELYIDLRTITLTTSLPRGQYPIYLSVYQPWDVKRLKVAGTESDLLMIGTYTRS